MEVIVATDVSVADPNNGLNVRTGSINTQRLVGDDAPDGLNFWLVRNTFDSNGGEVFQTPRHHHSFAQIKMVEKGSSNFVPGKDIEEGEIAYFPKSAWYGPQAKDNCTSFSMQFGFNGEHQRGKRWEDRRVEAMERLSARGRFEKGLYHETHPLEGEPRTRDSVEALYDERARMVLGKPLPIADEAYDSVILMHPKAFPYFAVSAGVELKVLGRFYDQPGPNGDVCISMVRLSDGGGYTLGDDRAQIGWTLDDGLVIDGKTFPPLTSFYSPRGETTELSGTDGIEVYLVTFPRLD
ncbi:MAG TPA: hypothetical protein VG407_07270 [Caulobacteraceae bacterium]|jgi:hypothetical protein|nr:hypothetical protein [Caulobacteraceae bacterium]